MKKYAYVQNGKVLKIGSVPKNTNRISGFNNLPDDKLAEHGWYVYEEIRPSRKPWERLGPRSQIIKENEKKVISSFDVIPISLSDYKAFKKKEISKKLTSAIENRGHDIYAQINAANGVYNTQKINTVKQEIKALYTEYTSKKSLLENATTYEEVEAVYEEFVTFVPQELLDENGHIIQDDPLIALPEPEPIQPQPDPIATEELP